MRGMMAAGLALALTGGAGMGPDVADAGAQGKKADKPDPPYTEYVKYEYVRDGKVVTTLEKVAALSVNAKWRLRSPDLTGGKPAKGDRVTTSDGAVFILDSFTKIGTDKPAYLCTVIKSADK